MKARAFLFLALLPAVYWPLDRLCRLADLAGGYTGDHVRMTVSFLVAALLCAHSRRAKRSQELGKERS